MASRILSFGDMLWDLFPEGPRFGGAPGNYACHAARLGGEVYMVSGVGTGERGTAALEVLKAQGVKPDLVQRLEDYPTGIVTVELAQTFKRQISTQACPECSAEGHDNDAKFCKYCGSNL